VFLGLVFRLPPVTFSSFCSLVVGGSLPHWFIVSLLWFLQAVCKFFDLSVSQFPVQRFSFADRLWDFPQWILLRFLRLAPVPVSVSALAGSGLFLHHRFTDALFFGLKFHRTENPVSSTDFSFRARSSWSMSLVSASPTPPVIHRLHTLFAFSLPLWEGAPQSAGLGPTLPIRAQARRGLIFPLAAGARAKDFGFPFLLSSAVISFCLALSFGPRFEKCPVSLLSWFLRPVLWFRFYWLVLSC
jgi:hypothetical protein